MDITYNRRNLRYDLEKITTIITKGNSKCLIIRSIQPLHPILPETNTSINRLIEKNGSIEDTILTLNIPIKKQYKDIELFLPSLTTIIAKGNEENIYFEPGFEKEQFYIKMKKNNYMEVIQRSQIFALKLSLYDNATYKGLKLLSAVPEATIGGNNTAYIHFSQRLAITMAQPGTIYYMHSPGGGMTHHETRHGKYVPAPVIHCFGPSANRGTIIDMDSWYYTLTHCLLTRVRF
jgi:hypothetical protein